MVAFVSSHELAEVAVIANGIRAGRRTISAAPADRPARSSK